VSWLVERGGVLLKNRQILLNDTERSSEVRQSSLKKKGEGNPGVDGGRVA